MRCELQVVFLYPVVGLNGDYLKVKLRAGLHQQCSVIGVRNELHKTIR